MSFFGKKQNGVTYGALIDIGSGSVGIGIVESDTNVKLPKVIYVHREYFKPNEIKGSKEQRFERVRRTLFSIMLNLGSEGLIKLAEYKPQAKISRILVTCSSPWSHTITRTTHYEHEDSEVKITQSFMNELIANMQEKVEQELNESEITKSQSHTVVERATVDIRLNGYQVHEPIGKSAKQISLAQIVGLIPQDVLGVIDEIQEKILTDTKLTAHTYMLVIYCVLRDLYPETKSLVIIDVTGESTEIGIVIDGVLTKSVHMPIGSNTLIREITAKSGRTAADVISHLRLLDENTSHEIETHELTKLLMTYETELEKTLISAYENTNIPSTLVITSLPSLQNMFSRRIPAITNKVTNEPHTVLEMSRNVLDSMAEVQNTDVFITIASRFFHKLHGCGEIEST